MIRNARVAIQFLATTALFFCTIQVAMADTTSIPALACEKLLDADGEQEVLKVGVRHSPPFFVLASNTAGDSEDTVTAGIAHHLWFAVTQVEQLQTIPIQYYNCPLQESEKYLENGKLDLVISPLTITSDREMRFDFSHPYVNSKLVIATRKPEESFDFSQALGTMRNALNTPHFFAVAAVFLVLFSLLITFALFNMKHYQSMPLMRDKSKPEMVVHVVIYSLLNISGLRKDVFGFSSIWMQLFSLLILLFGVSVSASLFSMTTAALSQSVSNNLVTDPDPANISPNNTAVLKGSTAHLRLPATSKEQCIERIDSTLSEDLQAQLNEACANVDFTKYQSPVALTEDSCQCEGTNNEGGREAETWECALELLSEARCSTDYVLGDWAQLIYLLENGQFNNLVILEKSYQPEPYGWGIANDKVLTSANNQPVFLRELINQQLLSLFSAPVSNDQLKLNSTPANHTLGTPSTAHTIFRQYYPNDQLIDY